MERLIECENGGFRRERCQAASRQVCAGVGIDPATAAVRFTQTTNPDGTISTPEIGPSPWAAASLDVTTTCDDLTTRSWWPSQLSTVPQATEFIDATVKPPTIDTHRLVLCPSGALYVSAWFGVYAGTFSLDAGKVRAHTRSQERRLRYARCDLRGRLLRYR